MKKEHQAGINDEQRTAADFSTSASVEANPMLSAAFSVEEGNKLIADFMGVKIGIDKYSWRIGCIEPLQETHLNYHKEWGWLMPVIEKIKELEFEVNTFSDYTKTEKYRNEVRISELGKNEHCRIFIQRTNAIEALWCAVVDFIKWYNKNTASVGSR